MNQEIIAKADAALASLQQNKTCEKCHLLKRSEQPDEKLAFANVEPANIPQIWLQHARFDHAARDATSDGAQGDQLTGVAGGGGSPGSLGGANDDGGDGGGAGGGGATYEGGAGGTWGAGANGAAPAAPAACAAWLRPH